MKTSLVIIALLLIFVSCRKSTGDAPAPGIPDTIPSKDTWIAAINKEMALVLEKVYENDSAYWEVNATIYSGYYEDERVLLRDLLFPEKSDLYQSEAYKTFGIPAGIFQRVFNQKLNQGNYPLLKPALDRAVSEEGGIMSSTLENSAMIPVPPAGNILTGEGGISVYFPYSEYFADSAFSAKLRMMAMRRATIVATDRDADAAPGRAPYSCTTSAIPGMCYKDVTADDLYAVSNPTHIIGSGAHPREIGYGELPLGAVMMRVYLGWSKLTRQMDNFISLTGNGGGSEIKVGRLSGYLKLSEEQVTGFSGDMVTLYFTRSEIRKGKWKRVFSIWDNDWNKDDFEQVYAVYEDDTKGKKTISGTVSTTMNLQERPAASKIQGEIGYKVDIITQDEILTQRKVDRASFFRDGLSDQGWKYMADPNDFLSGGIDWPVYDGGTIWQYTMPWRGN